MSKARTLANLISDNAELADGQISVAEVVGAAPTANPSFTGVVGATTISSPTLNATINLKTTDANGEGIGLGIDADKKVRFYDDQGVNTKMYWNASTATQKFEDSSKIAFGSSEDLKIYHSQTTGNNIDLSSNPLQIKQLGANSVTQFHKNSTGHGPLLQFFNNGASHGAISTDTNQFILSADGELLIRSGGGSLKLATTSLGVEIQDTTSPRIELRKTGSSKANIKFDTTHGLTFDNSSYQFPIKFYGSNFVFNESGIDSDFRVESDGNANMLFVDAGNNRVGVGTGSPATKMHIYQGASGVGTSATNILTIENNGNARMALIAPHGSDRTIMFGNPKDSAGNYIVQGGSESGTYDNDYLKFIVGNRNVMQLVNGNVGIGTGNPVDSGESTVTIGTRTIVGKTVENQSLFSDNAYYTGSMWTTKETDAWAAIRTNLNSIRFHTGGTHTAGGNLTAMDSSSMRLYMSDTETVFNDVSTDTDFRVESDSNANAFVVNAGTGRVGVNNSNPTYTFEVGNTSRENMGIGWARHEYFTVGIPTSGTRWYKLANYAVTALQGQLFMNSARNGGANQSNGARMQHGSLAGYNGSINSGDWGDVGTNYGHTAYYVTVGGDANIYLRVNGSVYGGEVYCHFEGRANWVFDGSYVTSAP